MKKLIFLCFVFSLAFCLTGCDTPEGGSSLPWSQPQSWENQINIGAEY